MHFTKMHGCGNDYVFVEENELPECDISMLAKQVSDRKKGIGSDGLIVISGSDVADVKMKMYNADGSVGKMCGNGIRCLSKYAFEKMLTIKTRFLVETDSGIKDVSLHCRDYKVQTVTVGMGRPKINEKELKYNIDGTTYIITSVDMGNPHAVIFVPDPDDIDIRAAGTFLDGHETFPDGVNTEFVQVVNSDVLMMRVWERGSGETLACGTGACAAAVTGYIMGRCKSRVKVAMRGGTLDIEYDEMSGEIFMTGEAVEVFQGEWLMES